MSGQGILILLMHFRAVVVEQLRQNLQFSKGGGESGFNPLGFSQIGKSGAPDNLTSVKLALVVGPQGRKTLRIARLSITQRHPAHPEADCSQMSAKVCNGS